MNTPNPYAPPRANVEDVPNSAEAEPASRMSRFLAALADSFIGLVFMVVPMLLGGFSFGALNDPSNRDAAMVAVFSGMGIGFLLWVGANLYFVIKNRQTIGKKMLNIKVVRSDGSEVSLTRLFFLRNILNGAISMIPIVGGLYALVDPLVIFSDTRQCVHDKLADTIVINA